MFAEKGHVGAEPTTAGQANFRAEALGGGPSRCPHSSESGIVRPGGLMSRRWCPYP
jgi:hypothetical protein